MGEQLRIVMHEDGAEAERLEQLSGYLRLDLRDMDDVEVTRVLVDPPEGTRGVDALEVGSFLVTLLSSAALPQLITTIRGWLGRGRSASSAPMEPRTVKVELDGDTIELSDASSDEQDRLIELFVQRHQREPDPT